MLIDLVVYDGLDELDAIGPLEVLRKAGVAGADVEARLVTRLPQQEVIGFSGLRFQPDAVYQPGQADVMLVAGGGWGLRPGELVGEKAVVLEVWEPRAPVDPRSTLARPCNASTSASTEPSTINDPASAVQAIDSMQICSPPWSGVTSPSDSSGTPRQLPG